jgi:hypothetical protein
MRHNELHALLSRVANGETGVDEAAEALASHSVLELSCGVTLDTRRSERTGQGEVIFGPGKSLEQLEAAIKGLSEAGLPALATKLRREAGDFLAERFPTGEFHADCGLFVLGRDLNLAEPWPREGEMMVVSAGSSDMPVALEAYGTARFFGADCGLIADAGVAGVHRLTRHMEALRAARVLVVVAGMDGALPALTAGLVKAPVIAVPVSTGYGAAFGGLAALLSMLASCSPGVAVVNIDNGFGAAAVAARVLARPE